MYKKIPKIASSTVILTACTGGMGLLTKVQNKDIIEYCEAQVACYGGLYAQFYSIYCVDDLMDERQISKAFGCETEFDSWLFCEGIQISIGTACPFDYENYDDWYDARYGEDDDTGYYGNYEPTEDPCEDEQDNLSDCTYEFMYGENPPEDNEDTGWDTGWGSDYG